MSQIKAVIFDLDGTLVDTLEDLARSMNTVLEQNGMNTHPIKQYRQFVGNGIYKLVERTLPVESRTEERVKVFAQAFVAYYHEHLTDYTVPYKGTEELLKALSERDILVAVATNKPHAQAVKLVEACFPNCHFFKVKGHMEGRAHKPNPAIVEELIEEMGVLQDEVLYVGDSDVDMITAQNAKVKGIGVSWGFRGKEELEEAGAFSVIDCPGELLQFIG